MKSLIFIVVFIACFTLSTVEANPNCSSPNETTVCEAPFLNLKRQAEKSPIPGPREYFLRAKEWTRKPSKNDHYRSYSTTLFSDGTGQVHISANPAEDINQLTFEQAQRLWGPAAKCTFSENGSNVVLDKEICRWSQKENLVFYTSFALESREHCDFCVEAFFQRNSQNSSLDSALLEKYRFIVLGVGCSQWLTAYSERHFAPAATP